MTLAGKLALMVRMRSSVRLFVFALSAALLSACSDKTRVNDLNAYESSFVQGRRTVADGSKLKMIFEHDSEDLKIDRIDYKVYEGELYLWPVRASHAFEPVEFTLDTSNLKLRQPWQDHVYWVGAANWDAPMMGRVLNPSPLGDRVDRVKADVVPSASK